MRRSGTQPTLLDHEILSFSGKRTTATLERLEKLIPWEAILALMSAVDALSVRGGRPGYPHNTRIAPI